MTLSEKVLQLHTNNAPAIPRLGVQRYTYWSEGQHGINRLGADAAAGGQGAVDNVRATSFPTNFASSMSWDPALVYQETTAISDEVRGFLDKSLFGVGQNNIGPDVDDYGSLTFWAPTVNLDRDPRWGRTDEAFGEDPYFVSQMAGAFVNGYQGNTMSGQPTTPYLKVAATAKHFALNNVENNRNGSSSDATDENIRNYYTAQFRSLIEDSHVSGLMTSYNAINGTPAPADTYTANLLAQRTWGFDGYTTSDCGAVGNVYGEPPSSHFWAPPAWTTSRTDSGVVWTNDQTGQTVSGAAGGQAYALRAGTQLNCTGDEATLKNIQDAIDAGVLSEGVIDAALVRVFTMRMATGEFDPPARNKYTKITKSVIESPEHQQLAQKVADNSLVLLKNDNLTQTHTPLLPVDPASVHNVVILGDMANQVTLGGYSGQPTHTVNAVQGITAAVKAANPEATVSFDAAATSTTARTPAVLSDATRTAIHNADLVVLFAGTNLSNASEGRDRTTLAMPGNYVSLIDQVTALGNPHTALVLQSAGPVTLTGIQDKVPAILFSGYNGQSQGTALADVIFGAQNPSGHLNFTWYQDDTQLPDMQNYGLIPAETGGLGRTYQYFTGTPTYPFGYGLSYTTFAYSKIKIDRHAANANGTVKVSFDVTNTGTTPGTTVAQLYTGSPNVHGATLPAKRLVGFQKTKVLRPGQRQSITIPVKIADLALYDDNLQRQTVYPGTYRFQLATNATTILATLPVNVSGHITPKIQYVTVQPDRVVFAPGDTLDLTGTNPWITDDTAQASQHVKADHIIEAVNNDESFVDLSKAHISYASDKPSVASVDRHGQVTALGVGATTIRVTINGVTGTAPVVVKQPFAVTVPSVAAPGSTFTATTALPNAANARALTNVTVGLQIPDGWTATAATPATFARVSAGTTATTRWNVTVPAGTPSGNYTLTAQVTFTGLTGRTSSSSPVTVALPYSSLPEAYNNVGISDDQHTGAGSLDGGGLSLSAQALAAGSPSVVPGGRITHDGITVTWPSVQPGSADNVVASGQTIAVSGGGDALVFIGTANNGTASGGGTITYADGTTQEFALAFADWWANSAAAGSDILTTLPYINNAGGQQNQRVSLYWASIPLDPTKTVEYVTIPHVSDGPVAGLAMHIFDIAVG